MIPLVRTSAIIGLGLLLALGATIGPLLPASDEPGASLTVRLPGAVQAIVLILLAASTVLLLLLQRPRRPTEDGPLPVPLPEPRSPWAALLSLMPFVLLVATACYLIWYRWADEEVNPVETAITAIAGLLDLLALARKPSASIPFFDATIAVLLLLLAIGLFALLVIVSLAERLERWWAARTAVDLAPPAPARVAGAPADPRAEPDPRRAILRAWERFEHALAEARAPRAPWQTPAELMRTTLARLPVPAVPVRRLTALFELARFSDRPLDADARAAACDSVDEITAALAQDPGRAR